MKQSHSPSAASPQQAPLPVAAGKSSRLTLVLRILFTIATVCTIIFIFSNSAEIGTLSGEKSSAVTTWLNGILERLQLGIRFTEHRVRKLAHFSEYALLGFWLMCTLRVYTQRVLSHISWPLFLCLLIPVTDESLQSFIPGRSGQLRDVIIDFSGACAGLVCALFLLLLLRMFYVLRKSRIPL